MESPSNRDVRRDLENCLAVLSARDRHGDPAAARHAIEFAITTLREAARAIERLEAELDLLTAPERDAASEARSLGLELEQARDRVAALEQRVGELQRDLEIERHLRAEDQVRLRELGQRAAQLDELLLNDKQAFGRFMERALDEHERKQKRKR